jgi:hypothetical protein
MTSGASGGVVVGEDDSPPAATVDDDATPATVDAVDRRTEVGVVDTAGLAAAVPDRTGDDTADDEVAVGPSADAMVVEPPVIWS